MHGPDPKTKHPMAGFPQVCFIANTVKNPNIESGRLARTSRARRSVRESVARGVCNNTVRDLGGRNTP